MLQTTSPVSRCVNISFKVTLCFPDEFGISTSTISLSHSSLNRVQLFFFTSEPADCTILRFDIVFWLIILNNKVANFLHLHDMLTNYQSNRKYRSRSTFYTTQDKTLARKVKTGLRRSLTLLLQWMQTTATVHSPPPTYCPMPSSTSSPLRRHGLCIWTACYCMGNVSATRRPASSINSQQPQPIATDAGYRE